MMVDLSPMSRSNIVTALEHYREMVRGYVTGPTASADPQIRGYWLSRWREITALLDDLRPEMLTYKAKTGERL